MTGREISFWSVILKGGNIESQGGDFKMKLLRKKMESKNYWTFEQLFWSKNPGDDTKYNKVINKQSQFLKKDIRRYGFQKVSDKRFLLSKMYKNLSFSNKNSNLKFEIKI